MKKIISLFLVVFALALPNVTAFAQTGEESTVEPIAFDYYISDENFNKLDHVDAINSEISTCSTGLIIKKTLSLAIDGNNLIIKASTNGIEDVKKCGFTYIKLQQYKNGTWIDYKIFEDLYSDSVKYSVTKSIAAAKGYKYRVTAQHYAKKSLLSIEKIVNTTSSLSF